MHLSKALWQAGDVSRPRGSPGIRFKTIVAILAVVQCLPSRGFQLLRSDSFSWLLHLPGNIELAGIESRGMILLAREFSNLLLVLIGESQLQNFVCKDAN